MRNRLNSAYTPCISGVRLVFRHGSFYVSELKGLGNINLKVERHSDMGKYTKAVIFAVGLLLWLLWSECGSRERVTVTILSRHMNNVHGRGAPADRTLRWITTDGGIFRLPSVSEVGSFQDPLLLWETLVEGCIFELEMSGARNVPNDPPRRRVSRILRVVDCPR